MRFSILDIREKQGYGIFKFLDPSYNRMPTYLKALEGLMPVYKIQILIFIEDFTEKLGRSLFLILHICPEHGFCLKLESRVRLNDFQLFWPHAFGIWVYPNHVRPVFWGHSQIACLEPPWECSTCIFCFILNYSNK